MKMRVRNRACLALFIYSESNNLDSLLQFSRYPPWAISDLFPPIPSSFHGEVEAISEKFRKKLAAMNPYEIEIKWCRDASNKLKFQSFKACVLTIFSVSKFGIHLVRDEILLPLHIINSHQNRCLEGRILRRRKSPPVVKNQSGHWKILKN